MATIKIKRRTTTGGSAPTDEGEISVNLFDNDLFIGDGANAVAFGGSGSFAALSGDQTIAGAKTFSSAVTLPAADPTNNTDAASKGYVDTEVTSAIGGLASAFEYKGTIDASAGTTTSNAVEIDTDKYSSGTVATGDYYKVSAAGYLVSTSGGTAFYVNANDSIVYNASGWDVIDNTNSTVASSGSSITVTGTADSGYNVEVASVDGGTF